MKFSQNIIAYHGCGKCYLDVTNEIAYFSNNSNKTFNPFWKNPIDANNKISKPTRYQIKKKPVARRKYIRKYFNYLLYLENKDTQSSSDYNTDFSDYDTDTETDSEAETAQNQNSNLNPELIGENLITDITKNNVKTETDEVLVINITQKPEQNPDNKKQNPGNKSQITKRYLTINYCNTLKLIVFYHLHFYSYILPLSFHKSPI